MIKNKVNGPILLKLMVVRELKHIRMEGKLMNRILMDLRLHRVLTDVFICYIIFLTGKKDGIPTISEMTTIMQYKKQ